MFSPFGSKSSLNIENTITNLTKSRVTLEVTIRVIIGYRQEFEKAQQLSGGCFNFKHGEASRETISRFAGFFYNSKFDYNGKFHS